MSERVIRHLSPAADNSQDFGQPALRWKNGYFSHISDGNKVFRVDELLRAGDAVFEGVTSERDGLMPADLFAFLSGKGAYIGSLTLYIRVDGNDGNDGLSEGDAVRTGTRAIELLNTRYYGCIGYCELNIGPGVVVDDWTLFDINSYIDSLSIKGVGIDGCTLQNNRMWDNGDFEKQRIRRLYLSDFCYRLTEENLTAPLNFAGFQYVSLSNVHVDTSRVSTIIAAAAILGRGGMFLEFRNEFRVSGNYSQLLYMSTSAGAVGLFGASSKLVYTAGSSTVNVVRLAYGQTLYCLSPSANYPVYSGATPTRFGSLANRSKVVFTSAAAQTAWVKGLSSTLSAGSELLLA